MPELIIPPKRFDPVIFRRVLSSQGVVFQAGLPVRQPHNLREHQTLQVLDLRTNQPVVQDGKPKVFGYPALRTLTQGLVYEDVVADAAGGDEDSEVLKVFMDFIRAVEDQLPMGLRELCHSVPIGTVAVAANLRDNQLTARLRGQTQLTVRELYKIHKAFPEMCLLTAFEEMAQLTQED